MLLLSMAGASRMQGTSMCDGVTHTEYEHRHSASWHPGGRLFTIWP